MPKLTESQQVEIVALYERGATAKELAERFQVSTSPIFAALHAHEVPMRAAGPRRGRSVPRQDLRSFSDEQEAEIARRYTEGAFIPEMATEYGVSGKAVNNALRRRGVALRSRREATDAFLARRDDELGARVTGRYVGADGYVSVCISRNHPFYGMMRSGRVLEHRLVMAESLGRPLAAFETVHHVNGDRADNRLENLQLRHGRHGNGNAMVCADCGSHNVVPASLG